MRLSRYVKRHRISLTDDKYNNCLDLNKTNGNLFPLQVSRIQLLETGLYLIKITNLYIYIYQYTFQRKGIYFWKDTI